MSKLTDILFTFLCNSQRVREICQFDLTCPISGVGPEVVRKLLLEENLKIRERKDSKVSGASVLLNDC